jgi:hypothetical protein
MQQKIDKEAFQHLLEFRSELFTQFTTKRIQHVEFGYRTYFFFKQHHYKFIKKAHDVNSVLFNYYYWTSCIERRTTVERQLEKYQVASEERLAQICLTYVRRRNQMVRRLLYEFSELINIEYMSVVHGDLVEVKIKEFEHPIYCNKEVVDRLKISKILIKKSIQPYYLPFLVYQIK